MKFIFFMLIAIANCESIADYYDDAVQLYFDEIVVNKNHPNYNNPILDPSEINKVFDIIQAVYNSKSAARDAVFDVYQIHQYHGFGLDSLILKVNPQLPYVENLSKNIIPTGNKDLDEILSAYEFDTVKTSYGYPDFPYLTVSTKKKFNLLPIVEEFMKLDCVVNAQVDHLIGESDSIRLVRENTSGTITFIVGWGDCPAGCINHHYWAFTVENGSVQSIEEKGDPLPGEGSHEKKEVSAKERREAGSRLSNTVLAVVVVLSVVGTVLTAAVVLAVVVVALRRRRTPELLQFQDN